MKIRIQQYQFDITEPYQPGQVLTAETAQALNGLRADNIRNNMRRAVHSAVDRCGSGLLPAEVLAELQSAIAKHDREYQFQARPEARALSGTLEAEIRAVALERVEAQVRQQGREASSAEIEAMVPSFAELPGVQAEARKRMGTRLAVAKSSMEDLL